ncbi:flagellar export protein FliJ [Paenibacillus endoradicis]|uniref:flagellar export protein FliJ n=1 Tax=Paenibacillus endoradicis TaxID=2972487 RepID=UPI0021594B77|nr:flagellar export protein FliJ [Paenibacillus endoradicis]MCR8656252.1 flagellar export protein FliJ [Paenibacillus endoradicis]
MASFKYTFQKIVDLKGSEKTQAEWILSDALAELRAEQDLLEQYVQEQKSWELKLEQSVLEAIPLSEVLIINQYIEYCAESIKLKQKDIMRAERKVFQKRQELASKMKEEKVWHKAKEHAFDKFKHETQLKEQNELDEMASIRFMSPTP